MNQPSGTSSRVLIVLPAYNEQANLDALLGALCDVLETVVRRPYQLIVVDDGSSDGTAAIAERWVATHPVTLLRHTSNQGLGATLRDGFAHAGREAEDGDVIVCLDADGSHLPAQIPALLAQLDRGADVAIASRFQPGSQVAGVPLHRRLLTEGARQAGSLLLGLPGVRDYTCGFRAYRADLIRRALARYDGVLVTENGFAASLELLLRLAPLRPTFAEIPMDLRYDLKLSRSKMAIGRTVARTLGVVLRHRLGPLLSTARGRDRR